MFSISTSPAATRSLGSILSVSALAIAIGLGAVSTGARADDSSGGSKDPVVAKVGSSSVHLSDVVNATQQVPADQQQQMSKQQLYTGVLEELVGQALLIDTAKKAIPASDKELKKALDQVRPELATKIYVRRLEMQAANDDTALHALYNAVMAQNPQALQEAHARHILVGTEADAKEIISELDQGGDFAKIAASRSTDKNTAAGGDLGWFTPGEMVPEFSNAAFSLKKGQYTKTPVHTNFGWHVIQLLDLRPESYDDAKPQLQSHAAQQALQDKVQELRSKVSVTLYEPDGKTPLPLPPAPAGQ